MSSALWAFLDANAPALGAVLVAFLIGVDLGRALERRRQ